MSQIFHMFYFNILYYNVQYIPASVFKYLLYIFKLEIVTYLTSLMSLQLLVEISLEYR